MSQLPVFLGLDVGKKRDRAAWVGVGPDFSDDAGGKLRPDFSDDAGDELHHAAWVAVVPKRLGLADLPAWSVVVCEQAPVGTSYAAVAARTQELARAFAAGNCPVLVAVDVTGVGAAVVEDLRRNPGAAEILAVTSHAGNQVTGQWPDVGVPKKVLVGALDEVMQRKALAVRATLPAADVLKAQLKAYVEKVKRGGRGGEGYVTYEAEHERDHDDTVAAAQLGLYAGRHWFEVCRQMSPGRR